MKKNVLNSPRLLELKRQRKRIFASKIMLGVIVLGVIVWGAIYLSNLKQSNFKEISVMGAKSLDVEAVKQLVSKDMAGNYLWFFPKTNNLFYPKNLLKKDLLAQFKKIKDVSFAIKDNQTLEVNILERTAMYTWCGNSRSDAEEKCYFMDGDGYIFDEAAYFSGDVYFKFYGEGGIGNYFAKENLQKLIDFKNDLVAMKFKPVALEISNDGDTKIFLSNTSNGYIIFKTDADFKALSENLASAITTDPLQSNLSKKYFSLSYIDLRFGNKVYYKF